MIALNLKRERGVKFSVLVNTQPEIETCFIFGPAIPQENQSSRRRKCRIRGNQKGVKAIAMAW